MDKRTFLKNSALVGVGSLVSLSALGKLVDSISHLPAEVVAKDEDFWQSIRRGYKLRPEYINLENGYYCILPEEVLEQYIGHLREVNLQGAYYMRTVQEENKKAAIAKLAELAGCLPEELIVNRNITEGLDLVISGQDWKVGDEAVMAIHDYETMQEMFKEVSKRYGTVNKIITVPLDPKSDEEIVELYANAITPKTKLLMICHVINITGQILPVRKICDMAHSKNVPVMVDGAHAFAHIAFNLPELNCDYYGASLHKWLSVPLGSGMLYIKKEHIPKIWPMLAEEEGPKEDDIARLSNLGTVSCATDLTITHSIDFYKKIGAERKEARLRYLQNYWTDQVRHLPHVIMNTPTDPKRSCAIANFAIKGMKPAETRDILLKKYKIYCSVVNRIGVVGCRVTPNVYTTTAELDTLVNAIKEL